MKPFPLLLLLLLSAAAAAAPVYVLTLRGRAFGANAAAVRVRVNGVDVAHVVLHSDTALSFVVPDALLDDLRARESSVVEVSVAGVAVVKGVPLSLLAPAVRRVELAVFLAGHSVEDGEGDGAVGGVGSGGGKGSDGREAAGAATAGAEELSAPVGVRGGVVVRTDAAEKVDEMDAADAAFKVAAADGVHGPAETPAVSTAPPSTEPGAAARRELYGEAAEEEARDAAAGGGAADTGLSAEAREKKAWLEEARGILGGREAEGRGVEARRLLESGVKSGDARAMALLGEMLLAGDVAGFERDFDDGVRLVKAASDTGDADGQAMLGLLYASGMAEPAVKKDIGMAVLLWTLAAEGGSSYAKAAMAYRLHGGVDVPEDCDRAAEYYVEVAREVVLSGRRKVRVSNGGEGEALAQIKPPTPRAVQNADRKRLTENMEPRAMGESNEIIQYYKHSAERGDTAAQVMIGNLYYYGGANMPQDPERARALFARAAAGGRVDAHAHLGFMDLNAGLNSSAVKHLEKAAKQGDKLGLHGMGFVTLHGIGVPRDEAKAAVYFGKAAENEHPEAMYNLGLMYSSGIGVEESPVQAYRYFQEAARYGHLQSNYNLGIKRLTGNGPGPPDCNAAITKNLKGVAEQGSWSLVLSRALRSYEKGDYGNALFRYLQAAHAGIELAQYNAAFMLEHDTVFNRAAVPEGSGGLLGAFGVGGDGEVESGSKAKRKGGGREWTRPACVSEALDLYQLSSGQGYSRSMVCMGDLAYGEGNDMLRATRAYEKAARMRNAEASFNLGFMHAAGLVSKPDAFLAKRYFDQAKEFDHDAFLPASIAVFALRFHEPLLRLLDRWGYLLGDNYRPAVVRSNLAGSQGDDSLDPDAAFMREKELLYRYGDLGICVVLFGFLAWIVNARQRRLIRDEAREEEDDGVMDAAGLNGHVNNNGQAAGRANEVEQ